ncbi:hypothetical protein [Anaerotignum sp.]
MQCTCELRGTATLIGSWTKEAIDCLNLVIDKRCDYTDGYGFNIIKMDSFSEETLTMEMFGEPNGSPGGALQIAWEYCFKKCSKEAPEIHEDLIRMMAQNAVPLREERHRNED